MKNELLKYLIIITLAYYLIKILIYILLWQTTYKVQERALAAKNKKKKEREKEKEIWTAGDDDD